jgi:hypothetical protein
VALAFLVPTHWPPIDAELIDLAIAGFVRVRQEMGLERRDIRPGPALLAARGRSERNELDTPPGAMPAHFEIIDDLEGDRFRALAHVAILSRPGLRPLADLNRDSILLGRSGTEESVFQCGRLPGGGDVNRDGTGDLHCLVRIADAGLSRRRAEIVLAAETHDGVAVRGTESLRLPGSFWLW